MVSEVKNAEIIDFNQDVEQQLLEIRWLSIRKTWNEAQHYAHILLCLPRSVRTFLVPPDSLDIASKISLIEENIKGYARKLHTPDQLLKRFEEAKKGQTETVMEYYHRLVSLMLRAKPNSTEEDANFWIKPKIISAGPRRDRATLQALGSGSIQSLIETVQLFIDNDEEQNELQLNVVSKFQQRECQNCGGKHKTSYCKGLAICKLCKKRGHMAKKCNRSGNYRGE